MFNKFQVTAEIAERGLLHVAASRYPERTPRYRILRITVAIST